jgi:predicted ATPase
MLGYPEAALADTDHALKDARDIGQAATLMLALHFAAISYNLCGNRAAAAAHAQELVTLAEEKAAVPWRATGMGHKGHILALTGKASDAVEMITASVTAMAQEARVFRPWRSSYLGRAYAELGQFDDAWRCIGEGMTALETTKERWSEAAVHLAAGEIALKSPEPDEAKAEHYFDRALAVARQQKAKSWELRAAMSMARLWRDQDQRQQAHDLLAPVYGWFTEGFDTLDLKQAKALLDQLR